MRSVNSIISNLCIVGVLLSVTCRLQRQVSFGLSSGKQELPPGKVKLDLKHIFHLGSPTDEKPKPQAKNVFRLINVPQASQSTPPINKEVDFHLLQKHIDTGGLMAFEEPNEAVLQLRKTILNLAKMAEHAYDPLPSTPWEDMEPGWHVNTSFGWNGKSVRGYVFSDQESKVLIISFKGTTLNFLPGGGETVPGDKESDNLMFSCCYGNAISWSEKNSCSLGNNVCSQKCLDDHISANTTYYHGAQLIYDAVVEKYGHDNIMLVGHSLGGSLASLVGLANKKPAFTFEAPGEKLYAKRLGIDTTDHDRKPFIFHHGHNADPLFLGTCNGKMSLCYLAGYGMDSKCHTSTSCVFDAVGGLNWSESLLHHRITDVVDQIYEGWADGTLGIDAVCINNRNCTDCSDWEYTIPFAH